jgi:hypothetical protein
MIKSQQKIAHHGRTKKEKKWEAKERTSSHMKNNKRNPLVPNMTAFVALFLLPPSSSVPSSLSAFFFHPSSPL